MTCDQNSQSVSTNFSSLPNDELINILLGLVEKCLSSYRQDLLHLCPALVNYKGNIPEILYNFCLSFFLKRIVADSPFCQKFIIQDEPFDINNMLELLTQKGLPRRPDFGIFLQNGFWLCSIEGKKLSKRNDKQYISGDTGGLQRYKLEQHGEKHPKACIIGYMEKEDFNFWHKTINHWIASEQSKTSDLLWGENELLQSLTTYDDRFSKCHSNHARITQPPIELVHYWVNVV